MIRLEIENDKGRFNLVLNPDTSIRMEHNSPLFQTDVLPGSRTYSFGIPINDPNRLALQFPEKLMHNGRIKIYKCNYYFHGKLISSGRLLILRSNSDYQATFIVNDFAHDYRDSKINEVIDEAFELFFPITQANDIIERDYPDVHIQFPEIYNDKFYDDAEVENGNYGLLMNHFDSENATFIANYYDVIADIYHNINTLVPQPYFYHVISEIFKWLGYEISGDFSKDANIKKLLIYNNYALDKFSDFQKGLNIFHGDFNIKDILPDISLREFINAIKDFFAVGIFFDTSSAKVLMIYKKTILNDNRYYDIDAYTPDEHENTFSENAGFSLEYNFDGNSWADLVKVDLSKKTFIEVEKFSDLYPFHGDTENLYYVKNTGQFYISKDSLRDDAWTRQSEKYYPITSGDKKLKIKTAIGPVLTNTLIGSLKHGIVPIMRETGTSLAFGTGKNDPGLKLMIWHGKQRDVDGKLYPCASSLNYDSNGNKLLDFSLLLDDENGIYNLFHKDWLEFQTDADEIRVVAKLPVAVYFKILEVFSVEETAIRKIRYRGINFIPEKISAFHKMNSDLVETEFIMHKKSKLIFKEETNNVDFLDIAPLTFGMDYLLHYNIQAQVKSLSAWIATKDVDWILLVTSNANGNGNLRFTISENPNIISRTAQIVVTNNITSKSITITQGAAPQPAEILTVSPDVINASYQANSFQVSIVSDTNWTLAIAGSGDIFISHDHPTGIGSGNATFNIIVQTNEVFEMRNNSMLITGISKTISVLVIQQARPIFAKFEI
jgi:hypothetical protein